MPSLCTVITLIMTLTVTGVLISLIWCSLLPPVISATAYCVRPQAVDLCSCSGVTHDCKTFDEYVALPVTYFTSGVTFQFMSGYHTVYNSLIVKELTGLLLVKDAWATDSVTVQVPGPDTEDYWFTIHNSQEITISGIDFNIEIYTYIFQFDNVTDVIFQHISYVTKYGGGFISMNHGYNITLRDASIVFINPFSTANDKKRRESSPDSLPSGVFIKNTAGSVVIDSSNFNGPYNSNSISIRSANFNYSCVDSNEVVISNSTLNGSRGVHLFFEETSSGCLNISVHGSVFKMAEKYILEVMSIALYFELDVEFNSNIFETSSGYGVVFSLYVFNNVYIHNCTFRHNKNTALVVFVGLNHASFHIENSVFFSNPASAKESIYSVQAKALVFSGNHDDCDTNSIDLLLRNVSFVENGVLSKGVQNLVKPIVLLCIDTLNLINCSFVNNSGTPIWATSSTLFMNGNIQFIGNTAIEGAGIYFNGESQMLLYNATVNFTNNHALATGGAVQIADNSVYTPFSLPVCFVSVEGSEGRLIFANNTAENGGDAIYGGSLYQAVTEGPPCFSYVQNISEFIPAYHDGKKNNLSLISSPPLQVCLCDNDNEGIKCVISFPLSLYPGETIEFQAFTIGQLCGTVKGTVYAYTSENISIEAFQRSQKVAQYRCIANVLKYTVRSMEKHATLYLTAIDISGTDYFNAQDTLGQDVAKVCSLSDELFAIPLVLGMNFKECPPGFQLINGSCTCIDQLHKLASKFDVKCTIGKVPTIERDKSLYLCQGNNFTYYQEDIFSYSVGCLSTHCNFSKVEVHQHSPDAQCIDNHTGILCGKCHKGFSLAIGSSRCLKYCSNVYLLLLIPFAVLGVVLVAVIKCLNLTVSQGSLNGLIFYANIIQTSNSAFLSQTGIGGTMLAVIIAWLNLDFGIETCFAHGLDMYLKT